jgi:hypothetical protein
MGKSLLQGLLLRGKVCETSLIDEDNVSTEDQHHLLPLRARLAFANAARALGDWIFDELAWTSAACHLANSFGFAADEEVIARYLAIPSLNGSQHAPRAGRNADTNVPN